MIWAESFTIFERHGMQRYDISAEHDEINVLCYVDGKDRIRLEDMGWFLVKDGEENEWRHYV